VTFNGKERKSQLGSLRKKIHEHENGQQHKVAEDICRKARNKDLEAVVVEQQKHLYDSTTTIFRTVYSLMKNNRPFTDLPPVADLQIVNGLGMGFILHSDSVAAEISERSFAPK